MIEIRGQQAGDWQDLYEIRVKSSEHNPYIRPDWVKQELAKPQEGSWPLVALIVGPKGPQVVARSQLQMGRGRRAHVARLSLERHPELGQEAGRRLLDETIMVAEAWWNMRRLETNLPNTDQDTINLFQDLGFEKEVQLRQSVRISGRLVDELMLARLSGDTIGVEEQPTALPPNRAADPTRPRPQVTIRGGSGEDWEAFHTIWSQPNVYWGTMQIPYPSADWNRQRVQERTPEHFWPLVAEIDGRVVANTGLFRPEHNRSHVGHVGMMVHQDYQGLGIGSALMQAIIDLGENWLGLSRLQLEVYTDNEQAIGLYEKFTFQTEGVCRAYAFRNGRYIDTLVMSRLKDQG